jgi:Fe-S-cluster-containing hydrogenase component 2
MLLDPFQAEMKAVMCRQCRKPFCLLACPENAIVVDQETGALIIQEELCTGCGECAEACPFNKGGMVLRLDEATGVYVKCDLCGGSPQCVEVCPTGALKYVQVRSG